MSAAASVHAAAARQPLASCNPRIATCLSYDACCQSSVYPLFEPTASDGQDRAGNWYLHRLPSSWQVMPTSACMVTRMCRGIGRLGADVGHADAEGRRIGTAVVVAATRSRPAPGHR